jgi:hypothetical protein
MDTLWLTVKDISVDIKINAQGRYIEVIGINESTALEYAASIVYDLWAATELTDKEIKEVTTLTAGTGSYLERSGGRIGFADIGSGERLPVK